MYEPLSAMAFRASFPSLRNNVHLCSCSLGARSHQVTAAVVEMLEHMDRDGAPWPCFERRLEHAREGFARLIGARPEQIAILPNASIGAFQVASCLDWKRRTTIVTTDTEFPSIAHVWLAQAARGAKVAFAAPGEDVAESYRAALDDTCALVSVPMTTYKHGIRLPVDRIVEAAHQRGAKVFVDAYQTIGTEPINVVALDCDFLVAGAMKYMLGWPGIAFLYLKHPDRMDLDPQLTGWFGRSDPFAFDPRRLDFPETARRFETGTQSVPAVFACNAALDLLESLDLRSVRSHIAALTTYAIEKLTAQGEHVLAAADVAQQGAHIAVADTEPNRLAGYLAERRVFISPRGDVARLSFHYFNTASDIDEACAHIADYRRSSGAVRA